MKTALRNWQDFAALILAIICVILLFILASCSGTRKVQKDKTETKTEQTVDQETRIKNDISTKVDFTVKSETRITETIDTTLTVDQVPGGSAELNEFLKSNPLRVPVHYQKVTDKKEYRTQTEVKTDKSKIDVNTDVKTSEQVKVSTKDVEVKRTSYWYLILIAGAGLAVGVYFVVKKYKPDLFKKFG